MMTEDQDPGCDPSEIAVKSYFLGPAAENEGWVKDRIAEILDSWMAWRRTLNEEDGRVISIADQQIPEFQQSQKKTAEILRELAQRFESEIPKFSPRYIGHMFSETSLPALLGHILTLLHNPNNISAEGSRVGTQIEKEAVQLLCEMIGFDSGCGHFTSGGTIANFEFLFRAREKLAKQKAQRQSNHQQDLVPVLLVSSSKHYSWPKAMHYLGLGEENIRYIQLDDKGRMSLHDLQTQLERCAKERTPILGLVAIVGTTELGTVDPIAGITGLLQKWREERGIHVWLHIDAAYGGFFRTLLANENHRASLAQNLVQDFESMAQADSITLDPHKLGYVPYASGTFICKNREDYFLRSFTGPYIVSDENNLGNFTIEGSRSAAGAVATYASLQAFDGSAGYGRILSRTLQAKKYFAEKLIRSGEKILLPQGLDTNIFCFAMAGRTEKLSQMNQLNLSLFETMQKNGKYWISKTSLHQTSFSALIERACREKKIQMDTEELVLLRLTLMNPFILSKEGAIDHASAFVDIIKNEVRNYYEHI